MTTGRKYRWQLLLSQLITFIAVLLLTIFFLSLSGCDVIQPVPEEERPTVNVPVELRQENWIGGGWRPSGSCTWASMITLLHWQGRYETANWIRKNCGGGEHPQSHAAGLEQANIRYAYVTDGDVAFLEWACSTRRGCNITVMGGRHMITLVHLDAEWAATLDNNSIGEFVWLPRETLIAEWQASHGWAVTPIYTPAPPLP